MKRLVIAYHAYLIGKDSPQMIGEQFKLLLTSGLYTSCDKLYIGIVDNQDKSNPSCSDKYADDIEWIRAYWSFASSKENNDNSKVEIVVYPSNNELRDTLRWVRDHAKDNPDDYILFFHTKGITHGRQPLADWRRYMEYFVIENWTKCVQKLDEGYDCCGVMWNTNTPLGYWPHFSGAFYWATASYINTLNHGYLDSEDRFHMEFWIGSNPGVKVYEFHNSHLNDKDNLLANKGHYNVLYPRYNYAND
jgi:hypothetical protein